MAAGEKTLTDEQFATISVNVLHQTLIKVSRTVGKRIFRELEAGTRVALTQLRMEDGGQVRLDLTLDHTEFRGALNFSLFRDSVLALLAKMTETLKDEDTPLPALRMMDESGQATSERRLFGVPGLVVAEGVPNVLMMGATPSASEPVVLIELMYIDPEQFGDPGLTLGHGFAVLVLHSATQRDPRSFAMLVSHLKGDGQRIAQKHGRAELDVLTQVDRARSRQLHADRGADQSAGQHAVGYAFTKGRGGGVLRVEVQRVVIPRDRGKGLDLLIGDESRVGRGITDGDLMEGHVADLHAAFASFCSGLALSGA